MDLQQLVTWTILGIVVLLIVIPYFIKYRRGHAEALKRLKESRRLGIDRPRYQYPQIDASACVGCASCARACPEADVLAVVHGTSVVVNGQRCVGHGRCENACPVGALKVSMGDISSREDIPILTECNETTVPGIYIAGELGGLSLIRNAIHQGRMVVENIAAGLEPCGDGQLNDIAIVGAGPAGLTAALAAMENGLSYILIDENDIGGTILHYPRRKLVMTQPVEIPLYGWLEREEYSKEDLMEIWREAHARFSLDVRAGERVESVRKNGSGFILQTTRGEYRSRRVVLSMGRRGTPRKLGVPGEDLPKVMYRLLDAQSYAGRSVLVVGGGDSAVEAAVGLAKQPGTQVSISYRKSGFFRVKKKNEVSIGELAQRGALKPYFESQVRQISEKSVTLATPGGPVEIENDYVFVLIGGVPPFKMLQEMGITFGCSTCGREVGTPKVEEGAGCHSHSDRPEMALESVDV